MSFRMFCSRSPDHMDPGDLGIHNGLGESKALPLMLLVFLMVVGGASCSGAAGSSAGLTGEWREELVPGATGDCGEEAALGMGAEEKGSSGAPLKVVVIWEHSELMLSPSPSTSGTAGGENKAV